MIELELRNKAEIETGARSCIYSLIAQGFRFPNQTAYEAVASGRFKASIDEAAANLPYSFSPVGRWGEGMALNPQEFEVEYIQHFDVGGPQGAPCSLYEGEAEGGRMKTMEDLIRCYEHFDLRLATRARERPDHLAIEMEYMHYLAFKEADSHARGRDSAPYRQAQFDCLKVHLVDFANRVAGRIGALNAPFYSDLVQGAKAFCNCEFAYLGESV